MILYFFVFYVLVLVPASQKKTKDAALSIQDRVNLLKHKISDQIKEKRTSDLILPINSDDDYIYVDMEKKPITPIMDFDQRKKQDKFKMREIITPPTEGTTHETTVKEDILKSNLRSMVKKRRRKHRAAKPIDSFYRRLLEDDSADNEWIHCQDLITPFISGFKKELSVTKQLHTTDHSVIRLLQLLSLNTTGHTKEEIYSILYQISNIQIRLYQWDVPAMSSLINVLVKKGHTHTFKNIHHGLSALLSSWHMDFTNTTNLLKQARIFRPPCVRVSDYGGSTKTSRVFRYTSPTPSKSTCAVPGATGCKKNYDDDD